MDSGPLSGGKERENGKTGFLSGLQQLSDLTAGVKGSLRDRVPNLRPRVAGEGDRLCATFPSRLAGRMADTPTYSDLKLRRSGPKSWRLHTRCREPELRRPKRQAIPVRVGLAAAPSRTLRTWM